MLMMLETVHSAADSAHSAISGWPHPFAHVANVACRANMKAAIWFIDPVEKPREAFTRVTLARGFDIHAIISFDYWVNQAAQFRPVWSEMVRSLQIGRVIADPTKGEMLH